MAGGCGVTTLDTVCPICDTDFVFDLRGSWDDFQCPACAAWLELEVDDWVEYDETGEVVDDGVDYSVRPSETRCIYRGALSDCHAAGCPTHDPPRSTP